MKQVKVDEIDINSLSLDEAKALMSKWSKRANERLRALERGGLTRASNAYRTVEKHAFDQRDWLTYPKNGEIKFRTDTRGRELPDIRKELGRLNKFLNVSHTSTKKQLNAVYQQAYETFIDNHPEVKDLDFKEYMSFWTSRWYDKLDSMFGSDQVVQINEYAREKNLSSKDKEEIMKRLDNDDDIKLLNSIDKQWSVQSVFELIDEYSSNVDEDKENPMRI